MFFDGNKIINKDIPLPNYELTTVIKKVFNNNTLKVIIIAPHRLKMEGALIL